MLYTRRDIGKIALAAGTAARLMAAKPNSNFGGVQIGAITYSFRALPGSAEETLKYCLECGISAIELMSNVAENYAGAPAMPAGVRQPTPEQQAASKQAAAALKAWRTSVSMDKYKAFRKMYEDAGVKIYAFKLPPTMGMSDQEYEYIWNVGETLGANHITMELPGNDELLHRVADYAGKRKLRIAFHTHGQGGDSGFDKALDASPYTALNLDVGHYFGVNGKSPVAVIEKYHDRIASLHLKDRKGPQPAVDGKPPVGGPNMPWGQGETPLKEVLQLLKARKYKIPGSIEYEYDTPAGSDVLTEVKKCVDYCKSALA
ncbi:MAG: Xylose isomerase domain protein barrel [Candidatus Solibacter sp.]|jgi:sugar phosphate isomerase/epimerase|nr:Xylose isomerase domain protein barrel [Candidatus Solibacter sp.]